MAYFLVPDQTLRLRPHSPAAAVWNRRSVTIHESKKTDEMWHSLFAAVISYKQNGYQYR